MSHWILTRSTMQAIVRSLDLGLMTLSAAKNYFRSYGVEVPGTTKKSFIKNLSALVSSGTSDTQFNIRRSRTKMTSCTCTCTCKSYSFPHRLGGGSCEGKPIICSHCGKTCDAIVVDYGVGLNEYWGSVSVHHDYQTVSDCCEEPLSDNLEN